jgi:type II secretory pathway component PulJ
VLSRVRDETGITLIELLVGSTILVFVMLVTFAAFNSFGNQARINFSQNEAQSAARIGVDRLARELRNTSSPGLSNSPIQRANGDEIVFQTVDPSGPGGGSNSRSIARVRYCVQSSTLWRQVSTWTTATPPALPTATACPDSSYGTQTTISDYVANYANGQSRPVFTYDASSLSNIGSVTVELYTDKNTAKLPSEQRLKTMVFLRGGNRAPTATFSANVLGNRHVLLNASASQDPDQDDLTYTWYDGSTQIGSGVIFDYTSPSTGNRVISVTVADPTGLSTTSPTQTVNVT